MFDFPVQMHSMGTALFCLAVYLFMLFNNYTIALARPYGKCLSQRKMSWNVFLSGLIIVCFCQKGDFFHMMEHVSYYSFIPGAYNYGEDIYIKIAQLIDKNYFLFRSIVFGGAFSLYCLTVKRFRLPVYNASMLLFCSYLVLFSYARASAAMAVYFFGLSFLCVPLKGKKWLSYILGAIIIYSSWEFHNSAIIMILTTIILFMPIKKWSIILILLGIPLITIVAKDYFFVIAHFAEDSDVGERMQRYSEVKRGSAISQTILNTFKFGSFYLPLLISAIVMFVKNDISKFSIPIVRLFKITFGIILIASVLYLFGQTFFVLFYRTLFMSMIPLCILVTALYKDGSMSLKQFKWCYLPGLIFCALDTVYNIYDIYVNS